MLDQLQCPDGSPNSLSDDAIDGCRAISVPGFAQPVQAYAYVSDLLEGSTDDYWPMIGWMLLTIFVLRAFSLVLFKTISHINR